MRTIVCVLRMCFCMICVCVLAVFSMIFCDFYGFHHIDLYDFVRSSNVVCMICVCVLAVFFQRFSVNSYGFECYSYVFLYDLCMCLG